MRRRYFATFRLGKPESTAPYLPSVFEECVSWLCVPSRAGRMPAVEDEERLLNRDYDLGGGQRLAVRSYGENEQGAFSLAYTHPGRDDPNIEWRTNISAARKLTSSGSAVTSVALTVLAGRTGSAIAPEDLPVSRPRIVLNLLEAFGGYGTSGHELSATPHTLSTYNVDDILSLLVDEARELPVVVCSALSETDELLVDPDPLADRLAGLAHVYYAENRFPSFRMRDALGTKLNTFNGAVRVYWPGFSTDDAPYTHALYTPDQLYSWDDEHGERFAHHLLRRVSAASLNRQAPRKLQWTTFEQRSAKSRIEELSEQGESEELAEELAEYAGSLEKDNKRLQKQLDQVRKEAERARREADQWRTQYHQLQKGDEEVDIAEELQPESVKDALEALERKYPDRIVVALNSQSEVKGNPFEDVANLYDALEFIATEFYAAKAGHGGERDLKLVCKEDSGFDYRRDQSDITMGKYSNYYETHWEDQTYSLGRHVGTGSGTDPRHTIRVAFAYDEEREKVIIGYVGQHQRTDAT